MKNLLIMLMLISNLAFAKESSIISQEILPVQVINNFEAAKYLGDWYEIARLPFYFEEQCIYPVKAHYELDDNDISVTNSCMTNNGKIDIAHGRAYFVESNTVGKLEVTFVPAWLRFTHIGRGDYWILYTDYNYSLVGSPNHKYLWILSRTDTPKSSMIDKLLKIATQQGFDISKLHYNITLESK